MTTTAMSPRPAARPSVRPSVNQAQLSSVAVTQLPQTGGCGGGGWQRHFLVATFLPLALKRSMTV